MRLTAEFVDAEWPQIVADSAIDLDRAQLLVVPKTRPADAAESAYWAPSFHGPLDRQGVYRVVRHIGDRSEAGHHLVVIWVEIPGYDEPTVAALLRHEVEHAAQWERFGTALFDDLDDEVRRAGEESGHSYSERPTERAANDAARDYVRCHYGEDAVVQASRLLPWEEVEEGDRHLDVRAETDSILRAWAPDGHEIESNGKMLSVDDFLEELGPAYPLTPTAHGQEPIVFLANELGG